MNNKYPTSRLLIFSDLDGCLLDHHDYSYQPAATLLQELETLNIPVIPASSKTESELLHLRQAWDNPHPFIIENGAAVYIPKGYFPKLPDNTDEVGDFWVKRFTHPRRYWQTLIEQAGFDANKFQTFADCTAADIAKLTGLEQDAAVRASMRQYGEPVAWHGTLQEQEMFIAALQALGAKTEQGGRFLHVSGDCSKGQAMTWLAYQYKQALDISVTSVAIGDSQNDISMLESADIAVIIPSPSHPLLQLKKVHDVYVAPQPGPSGWAEIVSMILRTLHIT